MSAQRDASKGLSSFSTIDKWLINIYIFYLFVIPMVSIISYELMLKDRNIESTPNWWNWLFFLPIVIQISFAVNNLKVARTTLGLAFTLLRIPLGIIILTYLYGWSALYATSSCFAFEVFGFCLGLLFGAVLRKADISLKLRLLSIALCIGLVSMVYYRFIWLFRDYFHTANNSWLEVVGGIGCLLVAAGPYLRVFIVGAAGKDFNMGESKLSRRMTPALGISAVFYGFGVPFIVYMLTEY